MKERETNEECEEKRICETCKSYMRYYEISDGKVYFMNFGYCINANNDRSIKTYTLSESCALWESKKERLKEFHRRIEEELKKLRKPSK